MKSFQRILGPRQHGFSGAWKLLAAFLLLAILCQCAFTLPVFAGNGKGNTEPEELHTESPLYGKSALFCGDSICAAAVYDYDNMKRWGWAGRIARDYGMSYVNKGLDGASVSNVRGDNTIYAQLLSASGKNYDFIILHGGTNDGWDNAPVGEITPADNRTQFDLSSFAGGLEQLFAFATRVFPKAKIGYIINFQTPSSIGSLRDMSAYYDIAKEICDKWEIPYLDLYNDETFNGKVLQVNSGRYTADKIHPNGRGYDKIYPYVAAFMEEIAVEEELPVIDGTSEETSSGATSEVTSDAASGSSEGDPEKGDTSLRSFLQPFIFGFLCTILGFVVVYLLRKNRKKKQ